jgi:hypothetical protein
MPNDDDLFASIAEAAVPAGEAPSTLKSRIFSDLIRLQAEEGPLLSLPDCRRAGGELCVFEQLVAIAPLGEAVKSANPCSVCHARILGEHVENAPIWWPGCPYVRFQNR